MPSRARGARSSSPSSAGSRRTRRASAAQATDGEGERVDRHRQLQAPGRVEQSAEHRSEPEADVADRLHVAVRLLDPLVPGDRGHERELGRLGDREDDPEQGRDDQDRREAVEEAEGQRHGGAGGRDERQQPARLDPVDEEAGVAGDQHRRAEEADPEGRDGEAGVADRLDVESERDHRHPVAEGGEPDRAADQEEIAVAQQTRAHVGRIGRCAPTESDSPSA